jgi:hypothetical protein
LLGDGYTLIETVYGEEKIFCTGLTRSNKDRIKVTYTYMMSSTKQPRKDSFLSFELFESPLTSVSTLWSLCMCSFCSHSFLLQCGASMHVTGKVIICYFFGGLVLADFCVAHAIAYVAHFVFLRDV